MLTEKQAKYAKLYGFVIVSLLTFPLLETVINRLTNGGLTSIYDATLGKARLSIQGAAPVSPAATPAAGAVSGDVAKGDLAGATMGISGLRLGAM